MEYCDEFCIHIDIDIWDWLSFAEVLILKKVRLLQMAFIIGRGFAERQILKKWKWPYLLNWVDILIKFCVNIDIDKI